MGSVAQVGRDVPPFSPLPAKQAKQLPILMDQARKRRETTANEDEKLWIAQAMEKLDVSSFRERHVTTPMRRQAFDQFFVRAAIQEIWPKS